MPFGRGSDRRVQPGRPSSHNAGVRALEPDRLFLLDSGLWAVDTFQPVAAVMEPDTGRVAAVVSWAQLPPTPPGEEWPGPQVLADGTHLWVQHHAGGPLARVGTGGVEVVAWTDGLLLSACAPGVAWCTSPPPDQELSFGGEPASADSFGWTRLLRVDSRGRCTSVLVEARVRSLRSGTPGLFVEVDVDPWQLRSLGGQTWEVERATRWLLVPHDAPVPDTINLDSHGLPEDTDPPPLRRTGWRRDFSWHDPSEPRAAVRAAGLDWHLGWARDPVRDDSGLWRAVVATGHDQDGQEVQRHDLGRGTALAAAAAGDRLLLAVRRGPWRPHDERAPVDVLALDTRRQQVELLVSGGSVDITSGCWPLPSKPVDADSYSQQVLNVNDSINDYWDGPDGIRPLARGLSEGRTELAGSWPDTTLQWTFDYAARPGLRLRRRVRLFDELGRPTRPDHAAIHLMEDLDTGALPPAGTARDGILDL